MIIVCSLAGYHGTGLYIDSVLSRAYFTWEIRVGFVANFLGYHVNNCKFGCKGRWTDIPRKTLGIILGSFSSVK